MNFFTALHRRTPRMPSNAFLQVAHSVRVFLTLTTLFLTLAAVVLAVLAIGSLASLNAAVPPVLGAMGVAERLLSGKLNFPLDAFWRALSWAGLCCGAVWLAAYLKPRA